MKHDKPTSQSSQSSTRQQSGSPREPQPNQSPPAATQMGEGSYEGTRDYDEGLKSYLETADVKADAEAAKPASPQEAVELKKAEQEGLSHSKAPGQ
ncbi:MAG: hypothetical protein HHJ16_15440 [Polaromonas sp.]|uniref:hypothetical protein n=1 Tax=Polaromonas sp. TaxID=1869339 RepID=UPI0017A6E719|nr:hypothetical protein [Polaromonas sp.]NMM11653.1 hypothetical protein [Polaromonas sp.]